MFALFSIFTLQTSIQELAIGEWEIYNQSVFGALIKDEISLYGMEIIENKQTGQIIGTLWHNNMKHSTKIREFDDYLIDTVKFDFEDSSIKVTSFHHSPGKTFDFQFEESSGNYEIKGEINGEEISIIFKDDKEAELIFGEFQFTLIKYTIPKASKVPPSLAQFGQNSWWEEILFNTKYLLILLIGVSLLALEITFLVIKKCCTSSETTSHEERVEETENEKKSESGELEEENKQDKDDKEEITHRNVATVEKTES